MAKPHRHRFKPSAVTSKTLTISCKCGATRSRELSHAEQSAMKHSLKDEASIHTLWHKIVERIDVVATYPSKGAKPRLRGWDAQLWMGRFVARHPTVVRCHVDDAVFSNSALYLVPGYGVNPPHPKGTERIHSFLPKPGREWFGVQVLYVPQCTGEQPTSFFLYPSDHTSLLAGLKALARVGKAYCWDTRQ